MLYPLWRFVYNIYFHPLSKFPGPAFAAATKIPIAYYTWTGDLSYWVHSVHEKYQSEVVRISPDEINFVTPQAWQDIHFTYGRYTFQKDLVVFSGVDNIVVAPDADHRRLRRLLSHAFSDKALREQESILQLHVHKLLRNFSEVIPKAAPSSIDEKAEEQKGKVNLTNNIMFVVFDIISDLAFGQSFACLDTSTFHPWPAQMMDTLARVPYLSCIARFPLPSPIATLAAPLLMKLVPEASKAAHTRHRAWTHEQVEKRLNTETERADFLTYITRQNEDPEEGGMSHAEIHANAAAFLQAGAETTAALVTAVLYFLICNPTYYQRVVGEVRAAFATEEEIDISAIIDRLPLLQAVIDETFRLYPPAIAGQPRIVPSGGREVAGHFVSEGTSVQMHSYAIGHSSMNFCEPEIFAPERWLKTKDGPDLVGSLKWASDKLEAVQPFSVGSRNCLGKKQVSCPGSHHHWD